MAKRRVLVQWIGHSDLRAMAKSLSAAQRDEIIKYTKGELPKEGDVGPVKTLLQTQEFDEVLLLLDAVTCGEVEKKKITEALYRLQKSLLLGREHEWNLAWSWVENAIAEHGKRPFKAILAAGNPSNYGEVLDAADLDVTALPPGPT